MSYTLFYAPDSANIVVRMVLEELAVSYEALEVNSTHGSQRSEAFLRFNPQGQLPVLVDPAQNEPLFETAAILLHLADTHQALQLPPAGRGRLLKWLFFLSNTLHADLRALFYSERYVATDSAIAPLRHSSIRPTLARRAPPALRAAGLRPAARRTARGWARVRARQDFLATPRGYLNTLP